MATPAQRLRLLRLGHSEAPPRPGLKADINVTPLVDVVLVLLIIFMVVTPLIASGVAVDLPRTSNHERKADEGKDIIVSVTADKRIYVGTSRVSQADDVGALVSAERRRYPEKSVFVKGDARAAYGVIRQVMESLHATGVDDVVLGTEEITEKH